MELEIKDEYHEYYPSEPDVNVVGFDGDIISGYVTLEDEELDSDEYDVREYIYNMFGDEIRNSTDYDIEIGRVSDNTLSFLLTINYY